MKEIHFLHDFGGATIYAVLQDSQAQVWNGAAFVPLVLANWTSYALPLAESPATSRRYLGDFPAAIAAAGLYRLDLYEQQGGAPSVDDPPAAATEIAWDGAGAITPASLLLRLAAVLEENIDTTGGPAVSVRKALEAVLAVLAGQATYNALTGVEEFLGRDGQTPVVTTTLTGNGVRSASSIY